MKYVYDIWPERMLLMIYIFLIFRPIHLLFIFIILQTSSGKFLIMESYIPFVYNNMSNNITLELLGFFVYIVHEQLPQPQFWKKWTFCMDWGRVVIGGLDIPHPKYCCPFLPHLKLFAYFSHIPIFLPPYPTTQHFSTFPIAQNLSSILYSI